MTCVGSEYNPGCQSLLLTCFETVSLAYCCVGQASWPGTSGESPVSTPHLSIGGLGLQICATTPGFMWVLGLNSSPCAYALSVLSTETSLHTTIPFLFFFCSSFFFF